MLFFKVNEIFQSLQGEGFHTGRLSVFVRLSGCNLKCGFCDTRHQENFQLSTEEIVDRVLKFDSRHIVITGGEPTLQKISILIERLIGKGLTVQVETNGTGGKEIELSKGKYGNRVWITCSPKRQNNFIYSFADELKYIVDDDFEGKVVCDNMDNCRKYLQPEGNRKEMILKALSIIKMRPYSLRLSLQIQKLIGIQ